MRRAARVVAHAKVNLVLRVLAREHGGYHGIETLFARLALGDEVVVRVDGEGRSIDCRGADTGPDEHNLALRAAVAYAGAAGWPHGFAIEIDKHIPAGGGLGGGSADAGAVLRALDALSPRPVGAPALYRLAARLGSDVPYLTSTDALALAWGRGERMLALAPPTPRAVVLAFPGFGVSTADAYRWVDDARSPDYAAGPSRLELAQLSDWHAIAGLAANDFEQPVSRRHAEIATLTAGLRKAGAQVAMLSGSGSTVFGVFDQWPSGDALRALGAVPHVITKTLSAVPAVELID